MGRLEPLDNEPAPTLIRRLVCSIDFGLDSATYPIALCPYWLRKLQWREDAPGVSIDARGAVVARIVWWRDAGPVDIDDESIRSEARRVGTACVRPGRTRWYTIHKKKKTN